MVTTCLRAPRVTWPASCSPARCRTPIYSHHLLSCLPTSLLICSMCSPPATSYRTHPTPSLSHGRSHCASDLNNPGRDLNASNLKSPHWQAAADQPQRVRVELEVMLKSHRLSPHPDPVPAARSTST
eukprot:2672543-Rhodomonas_salina.1